DAQHLAPGNIEGYAVEGLQRATARDEFDLEVADGENGCVHRIFGFMASRSQSPSRFTAKTKAASVTPGKATIHHSPEKRKSLPMRISVPSRGWVGGSATPRKSEA